MGDFEERFCKECGSPFKPKKYNSVYCSKKCYKKAMNENRRKPTLPQRQCPVCGEWFAPKSRISRFCSAECRAKRYVLHSAETAKNTKTLSKPKFKVCAHCGWQFAIINPHQWKKAYCSEKCRNAARNERRSGGWPTHKPKIKRTEQPQVKREFSVNEYFCQRCRKKVHAKIVQEKKGKTEILELYCSICGDKIFNCTFERTRHDTPHEYDSEENPENLEVESEVECDGIE